MKKVIIAVTALVCSTIVWALNPTAVIKMNITSSNNSVGDDLTFVEDASYSTARNTGADIDKIMSITNASVNEFIYAFASFSSTGKLSMCALNQLEGTAIGIQGNTTDTQYTISFPNVMIKEGRDSLYLEDILLKKVTKIRPAGSYVFTIEEAQKGIAIDNRFRIYAPGEFKVCVTYNQVELYDNTGTDNIVITDMAGAEVVNVAPTDLIQVIDLSDKPAGHYILTVNGTQYEFCNKPVSDN